MFECLPGTSTPFSYGGVTRKRSGDGSNFSPPKRMRYFYRLESESSRDSNDTETVDSICSIQGYETDIVFDTPDTESSDSYIEIEYEIHSSPTNEETPIGHVNDSSSGDDDMRTAVAIAAVVAENSPEPYVTDGEDRDNSSATDDGDGEVNRADFGKCVQCNSAHDHPFFRYCKKCFQVRKTFFPPRPRGYKRKEKKLKDKNSKSGSSGGSSREIIVGLNVDKQFRQSNNSVIVADSGIGSSQDLFDQPINASIGCNSNSLTSHDPDVGSSQDLIFQQNIFNTSFTLSVANAVNSKISDSVSSLIETQPSSSKTDGFTKVAEDESKDTDKNTKSDSSNKKSLVLQDLGIGSSKDLVFQHNTASTSFASNNEACITNSVNSTISESVHRTENQTFPEPASTENKECCIICNIAAKNGAFLHGATAHMCCCYKCALRTWKINGKCPVCNSKPTNIIKVFVS